MTAPPSPRRLQTSQLSQTLLHTGQCSPFTPPWEAELRGRRRLLWQTTWGCSSWSTIETQQKKMHILQLDWWWETFSKYSLKYFSKTHLTEKPSCSNLLPRLLNGTSSRTSAYLVWKMFLTPQISLSVIYLKCCCVWLVDLSFEPASRIVFPQYSRRQPTVSDWLTHDDQTRFPQSSVHVQTCWGAWSTTTVAAQ